MTTSTASAAFSSGTATLFESLPATLADVDSPTWDEVQDFLVLEDFLTSRQLDRLVTEDHCFVCRRSTDHRGESHVATQESVLRFAASLAV